MANMIGEFNESNLLKSKSFNQARIDVKNRLIGDNNVNIHSNNKLNIPRPDYSQWVNANEFDKYSTNTNKLKRKQNLTPYNSKTNIHSNSNHQINLKALNISSQNELRNGPSPNHKFIALHNQAPIHEPRDFTNMIDLSTAYDRWGLCVGCFHRRGPHNHYQAPVRVGGGYSIFKRDHVIWNDVIHDDEISQNTLRWILQSGQDQANENEFFSPFGDNKTFNLFEEFVANGGNAAELKEYLESNFSEVVLEELRESGCDVTLLVEYTSLFRQHVKETLQKNIRKQNEINKKHDEFFDYSSLYTEIENDGVDMKMFLVFLKKGKLDLKIKEYEEKGGNIEILEHFADVINQTGDKANIAQCFQKYFDENFERQSAQVFLDFVESGGDLEALDKFVGDLPDNKDILGLQIPIQFAECVQNFETTESLKSHFKKFLETNKHLYQSASLLHQFIQEGGRVKELKDFVKNNLDVKTLQQERQQHENVDLLQKIGTTFLQDSGILKDLEDFPDDIRVIEAYIQRGGDFPLLVQEISDVIEKPEFTDYVQAETDDVTHRFIQNDSTQIQSGNHVIHQHRTEYLPKPILARIVQKVRDSMLFNFLVSNEHKLSTCEGPYLAQTLQHPNFTDEPSSRDPHLAVSVYNKINHRNPASVSSITGKVRSTLWVPPQPFEIQRSKVTLTKPKTPFSETRDIRIKSLTEDNILEVEKLQRRNLDTLRRTHRLKEFGKHWEVMIRSPRGSIVSEITNDSEIDFSTLVQPEPKPKPTKDKRSRRSQQREKMKSLKQGRPTSASSTVSLLSVPVNNFVTSPDMTSSDAPVEKENMPYIERNDKDNLKANEIEQNFDEEETRKTKENVLESKSVSIIIEQVQNVGKQENENLENLSTRYGTAFGPKLASSSHNSLMTAKQLGKLRDNPQTLIADNIKLERITSKSENNISYEPEHRKVDEILEKMFRKNQNKPKQFLPRTREASISSDESEIPEATNNDLGDLLKQYCIIREERIPLYRRIFDKYLLVKSIREKESDLKRKRENRNIEDEFNFNNENTETPEQLLVKNRFIVGRIKENVEEIQQEISNVKSDINSMVVVIARQKYSKFFDQIKEKKNHPNPKKPLFGIKRLTTDDVTQSKNKELRDDEVLKLLTAQMRNNCEADVEIRDRKVMLVHLRDKVKRLKSRQRRIKETCKQIEKQLETENVKKFLNRRREYSFTRKQSFLYRNLHPEENKTINLCDLKNALEEIRPSISFIDFSQIEGITESSDVTFHVFCVIAALHEKGNLKTNNSTLTLGSKIKMCKEHYGSLFSSSLENLQLDLTAVGINKEQKRLIIEKLSRGNSGRLEILDFMTYVPLFLDIHHKIISDPLLT